MEAEKKQKPIGSSGVNPFADSKVICPICESEVLHRIIRPMLYSERSWNVDLRPITLSWTDQELVKYHPRLYYMQHCHKCHFTASHALFAEPLKNCSLRQSKFRDTLLRLAVTDAKFKTVVGLLSSDFDPTRFGILQALKLHLLAIYYLQLFVEFVQRDALNLSRYCLRLAWLYRDIQEFVDKAGQPPAKLAELLETLKKDWPQAPDTEESALRMAAECYRTTLECSRAVKTTYDEVQLILMIARIQMQMGDRKAAIQSLVLGKEKTRRFETEIRKAAQAQTGQAGLMTSEGAKAPGPEIAKLQADRKRLNTQIEEVELAFERVMDTPPPPKA